MFDESLYLANIIYLINPHKLNLESKINIDNFEAFLTIILMVLDPQIIENYKITSLVLQ